MTRAASHRGVMGRRRRTGFLPVRTGAEWAIRGALAFLTVGVGLFAIAQSAGEMLRIQDPAAAWQIAPWDARNAEALAEATAPVTGDRSRANALALYAIRHDPTAVGAVATLAVSLRLTGKAAAGNQLFAYAETLSRRNLATQLWEIEGAVAHGDIAGALRHYDIALRTKEGTAEPLFPILSNAASDPRIRAGLIRTLAARPGWASSFTDYLARNGNDPQATAALFAGLRAVHLPLSEEAEAAVVDALIAQGAADQAWASFAQARAGVARDRSRDPLFRRALVLDRPSELDWAIGATPGITASFQRATDAGLLDFAAAPNITGTLAQQLQLLPPGLYRLTGHSIGIDQPERSRPYWGLRCHPDGRELGRILLPNSADHGGTFTGVFTVPAGCPMQQLALSAQSADGMSGVSGQIDRVALVPVR